MRRVVGVALQRRARPAGPRFTLLLMGGAASCSSLFLCVQCIFFPPAAILCSFRHFSFLPLACHVRLSFLDLWMYSFAFKVKCRKLLKIISSKHFSAPPSPSFFLKLPVMCMLSSTWPLGHCLLRCTLPFVWLLCLCLWHHDLLFCDVRVPLSSCTQRFISDVIFFNSKNIWFSFCRFYFSLYMCASLRAFLFHMASDFCIRCCPLGW